MRLSDLQRGFAHAVMSGAAAEMDFVDGPVPIAAALQVHRNTVTGALVNALRLSYPSVHALVGDAFFDQLAALFVRHHPASSARLAGYGAPFPGFAAAQVPSLNYLGDVARLDWAVEQALAFSCATRRFEIAQGVVLHWPVSLAVLSLNHPAGEIRAALDDDAALAAIDMTPAPRHLLVWRRGQQAVTLGVGAPAAGFVEAMLAGEGADAALARAAELTSDALCCIQSEIFAASFCSVTTGDPAP